MSDSITVSIPELLATFLGAWVGTVLGAFAAVWIALAHARWLAIRRLERALQREVAIGAATQTVQNRTIERLRKQRNELLSACTDARSALLEVQLEARAREEQIRRQAANSGFGAL